MKNLIITFCLSIAVSLAFAQIDVVGPGGDVGIGITNPTEKLDVGGKLKVRGTGLILGPDEGFQFGRTLSGSSRFYHYGNSQYQFRAEDDADITFWTRALSRVVIKKNGTFQVGGNALKPGGGSWGSLSDRSVKNNIENYTDGLNEILEINPVTYQFNDKTDFDQSVKHVGIIAQDIQKVAPYMVSDYELEQHTEEKVNKKGTYKSVDPSAFTYMLINAVKEQQSIIETQGELINSLQKSVDNLSDKVESISLDSSTSSILLQGDTNLAKLAQNTPNPLSNLTKIEYYVPVESQNAVLQIQDLNGKIFETVNITEKGLGNVNIEVKNMTSGLYTYTLKVDGKSIDTKKMIIK